mgnify:CR=1 FL=1
MANKKTEQAVTWVGWGLLIIMVILMILKIIGVI